MSVNPSHTFKFPWKPHAKQRPRSGKGGRQSYTPAATKRAEKAIREAFEEVAGDFDPVEGSVAVQLTITPDDVKVSISQDDYETPWKLRGDIDNYAKTILDALNGVLYEDDKQIVYLQVMKA